MIRQRGYRFSEKIMLKQKIEPDDDSKQSHRALVENAVHCASQKYFAPVPKAGTRPDPGKVSMAIGQCEIRKTNPSFQTRTALLRDRTNPGVRAFRLT